MKRMKKCFLICLLLGLSQMYNSSHSLAQVQSYVWPNSLTMHLSVMGDTATHMVWTNPPGSTAVSISLEKSTDGINYSVLKSAVISGIPDIFALYFPQDIDYFNTILYSTESSSGGYLYNDILEPTDPDTLWYRVALTDQAGAIHYFLPGLVSRITGEQIVSVNTSTQDEVAAGITNDPADQLKGAKVLCPATGSVPAGYTPTGVSQTINGTCCYYINTQYTSSSIQIVCGGGNVAWCCSSVPGAQNCPSGMKYDYCCAHTCGQYAQCVCSTPWQCCSMSQATVWVVTQSYNYPAITLSPVIVNESCSGMHNGAISVTVNNGTSPINYSWSGGYPNSPNLSNLPAGSYTVTVTDAHNCTASQTFIVATSPPPVVTLPAIPSMCISASPVTLTGGNPAGGSYSGPGVSNGIFNPATAGPGTHTIMYSYTAPNNCIGTANTTITVYPLPAVTFSAIGPFCVSASPVILTQGSPSGGAYTGTGVSNGTFNPGIAGVGTYNLVYVYTDSHLCTNSASQTVTVNPMPVALVNPIPPVCDGAAPFLLNYGVPAGGVFAGNGVANNYFNPSTVGPGVHAVVYFYTDNNQCFDTAFQTITVHPRPTVSVPSFSDMCINASPITLSGGLPAGGIYYVDGVQAAVFEPSVAGVGVHNLLYVYSDANTCTDSANTTINVNPVPIVTSTPIAAVCADATAFSLVFGSPAGGDYQGMGVNNGIFDPSVAGAGVHSLTYVYQDPVTSCINAVSETILVNQLPVVSLAPISPVCVYSPTFTIGGGLPAGGQYSGPGVNGTIFDPAAAGAGTHLITYTYANPLTGCDASSSQSIIVKSSLAITVSPSFVAICPGTSANIAATGALNYNWTPPVGLSTTTSPVVTARPQSTTTYTVHGTDATGCTGSASATVNVYPRVTITATGAPSAGCRPLEVQFTYNGGTLDSVISWNFDDPGSGNNYSNSANTGHVYYNSGSYRPELTVTSIYGCKGVTSVNINVFRPPVADFEARPEIVDMSYPIVDFIDKSNNANHWFWDFGEPDNFVYNSSELQSPAHTYITEGYHMVQLIVESGRNCYDTTVRIVEVLPEMLVFIPNSVTPNGDGINDVWKPVFTNTDDKAYELHIYDRWGKELWKTTDPGEAWNCYFDGKRVKEGIYAWILFFRDPHGKDYKRTGTVTVIP